MSGSLENKLRFSVCLWVTFVVALGTSDTFFESQFSLPSLSSTSLSILLGVVLRNTGQPWYKAGSTVMDVRRGQ